MFYKRKCALLNQVQKLFSQQGQTNLMAAMLCYETSHWRPLNYEQHALLFL